MLLIAVTEHPAKAIEDGRVCSDSQLRGTALWWGWHGGRSRRQLVLVSVRALRKKGGQNAGAQVAI